MPDSVESRLARLEAEHAATRYQVDAFGPVVRQVLQMQIHLEHITSSLQEIRGSLAATEDELHESVRRSEARMSRSVERIEQACDAAAARFEGRLNERDRAGKQEKTARLTARTAIIVALIGGAGTLTGIVLEKAFG